MFRKSKSARTDVVFGGAILEPKSSNTTEKSVANGGESLERDEAAEVSSTDQTQTFLTH